MRSAKLVGLYLLGIALIGGWSLSHVLGGSVTSDNFALVLVLPLAWIFSYWPTMGGLLLAWKMYRLQASVEGWAERSALGLPTEHAERELEDTLTLLAVQENAIPEKWARRVVRKLLAAARAKADAERAQGIEPIA
jgi:hypothetical protein